MTENEAKTIVHEIAMNYAENGEEEYCEALDTAIKALEEVQKYRTIEKDLKERYHANVDISLLMHHFIETVFEGEKHEGFCLLTNEDAKAWEEYKTIGAPEECREAVEKQTPISREIIEGKYFCPKCHKPAKNAGYCVCGQKLY